MTKLYEIKVFILRIVITHFTNPTIVELYQVKHKIFVTEIYFIFTKHYNILKFIQILFLFK